MNSINLKECRKILQLNQVAFSGVGMSREYISDVERGKSKLNKAKERIVVVKLLLHSLSQNIKLPLSLNDDEVTLLDLKEEFQCYTLLMSKNDFGDKLYLKKMLDMLPKQVHDFIYFINLKISSVYSEIESYELAYKYYKNAMEYAFNRDFESPIFDIQKKLSLFSDLAFRIEIGKDISNFYKKFINYSLSRELPIKPYTYYNLALFEKIESNFEEALSYLKLEFDTNKNISKLDLIDLKIMKSSILLKLNNIVEGMEILEDLLVNQISDLSLNQKSMITSNAIYFITKNKADNYKQLLIFSKNEILNMLEAHPEYFSKRYKTFANLGLYYYSEQLHTKSVEYFNKAYDVYFSNFNTINSQYIHLLDESFEAYRTTDHWKSYLKKVSLVNKSDLNKSASDIFSKLISKIFFYDTDRKGSEILELMKYIGIT